jgi:hypothetical protein
LAMVYVDDPGRARGWFIEPSPYRRGANAMLLRPFDSVGFDRTWKDDSTTFVAPSQAAVDRLTAPQMTDPLYVVARAALPDALCLSVVTLIAMVGPLFRATRIDPIVA